jgi:hypothetical protein
MGRRQRFDSVLGTLMEKIERSQGGRSIFPRLGQFAGEWDAERKIGLVPLANAGDLIAKKRDASGSAARNRGFPGSSNAGK